MSITVIPGQNFDGFAEGFATVSNAMQAAQRTQLERERLSMEQQYMQQKLMMEQQLMPTKLQANALEVKRLQLDLDSMDQKLLEQRASFGDRMAEQQLKTQVQQATLEGINTANKTSSYNLEQMKALAPEQLKRLQSDTKLAEDQSLESQQRRALITKQMETADTNAAIQKYEFELQKNVNVFKVLDNRSEADLQLIANNESWDPNIRAAAKAKLENPNNPMATLVGPQWKQLPAPVQAELTVGYILNALGDSPEPSVVAALNSLYVDDPEGFRAAVKQSRKNPGLQEALLDAYTKTYQSQKPVDPSAPKVDVQDLSPKQSGGSVGWSADQIKTSMNMFVADLEAHPKDLMGTVPGHGGTGEKGRQSIHAMDQKTKMYEQLWSSATKTPKTTQEGNEKKQVLARLKQTSTPKELDDLLSLQLSGPSSEPTTAAMALLRDMLLKTSNKTAVIEQAHASGLLYELSPGDRRKLTELASKHKW